LISAFLRRSHSSVLSLSDAVSVALTLAGEAPPTVDNGFAASTLAAFRAAACMVLAWFPA